MSSACEIYKLTLHLYFRREPYRVSSKKTQLYM